MKEYARILMNFFKIRRECNFNRILTRFSLNVRAFTWNRDSHGLFDYESQSVTKRTFKVRNDAKIYRAGGDVKMTEGGMDAQIPG